jgi:hypothetical protein
MIVALVATPEMSLAGIAKQSRIGSLSILVSVDLDSFASLDAMR